jgi:hypothetical protein
MGVSMKRASLPLTPKCDDESALELASLARMTMFVHQHAKALELAFPAYLLGLAHDALIEVMREQSDKSDAEHLDSSNVGLKTLN